MLWVKQIPISQLEKYMLGLVNESNLLDVNKVYRYIQLTKNHRKLQTLINKQGVVDSVENQHQKYAKPHFALKEMREIEKELKTIEDSLMKKTPSKSNSKPERKPLIDA